MATATVALVGVGTATITVTATDPDSLSASHQHRGHRRAGQPGAGRPRYGNGSRRSSGASVGDDPVPVDVAVVLRPTRTATPSCFRPSRRMTTVRGHRVGRRQRGDGGAGGRGRWRPLTVTATDPGGLSASLEALAWRSAEANQAPMTTDGHGRVAERCSRRDAPAGQAITLDVAQYFDRPGRRPADLRGGVVDDAAVVTVSVEGSTADPGADGERGDGHRNRDRERSRAASRPRWT